MLYSIYLTSIIDLYSRKIIAWTLSDTLEAIHVADTVRKVMKSRKVTDPLVLHSDRGSQYVSKAYLEAASKLQYFHLSLISVISFTHPKPEKRNINICIPAKIFDEFLYSF